MEKKSISFLNKIIFCYRIKNEKKINIIKPVFMENFLINSNGFEPHCFW